MNRLKNFVRALLPPVITRLLRKESPQPGWIWEGVYKHTAEIPTSGETYDDRRRVQEFADYADRLKREIATGQPLTPGWHSELAILAAMVGRPAVPLRVLDFGGGIGVGFFFLLAALKQSVPIRYRVIDLKLVTELGTRYFADDTRICIDTKLNNNGHPIDIVYASGVLPYVVDYADQLRQLADLGAEYVLFTQLAAGDFPSFATKQVNLPGQILPYWFLNLREVREIVCGRGYTLVYEAKSGPEYNQDNFQESHRIGRMRTLLFRKQEYATAASALIHSSQST